MHPCDQRRKNGKTFCTCTDADIDLTNQYSGGYAGRPRVQLLLIFRLETWRWREGCPFPEKRFQIDRKPIYLACQCQIIQFIEIAQDAISPYRGLYIWIVLCVN